MVLIEITGNSETWQQLIETTGLINLITTPTINSTTNENTTSSKTKQAYF